MSEPKRRVASSLGATDFNAENYSKTPGVIAAKAAALKSSTGTVKPDHDSENSPAANSIPKPIAAGQQPYERSGKRRIGVTRRYNNDVVKTTIVLPTAVHDKLQEMIFRNRKTTKDSLNDLVMQGLDLLFADYGIEPIDTLVTLSDGDIT